MERFIQYLDILEDAYYVVALLAERIRRILIVLGAIGISAAMVALALSEPPIGFAVAALLTVTVLYRSATANIALANMPE